MPNQKSFRQERVDSLRDWAARKSIPGIEQDIFIGILGYVLDQQDDDGFWNMRDEKWQEVMTGVVLKALARLHFRKTDRWSRKERSFGGVEPAVRFLADAVLSVKGNPGSGALGEDIWDACQALLALAEYDSESLSAIAMAQKINEGWARIYADENQRRDRAEWCGPAYLAAMVDVLSEYESDLGPNSTFVQALDTLKKLEERDQSGGLLGSFNTTRPRDDMRLWNTVLVLCTLVRVPEQYIDREQVRRITEWVLEQLRSNLHESTGSRAPMFLARTLHALLDARFWVETSIRDRIDQALYNGNRELSGYFKEEPPRGNLKSYTAVVEYLAAWTIPAPAGLLFEAKKSLDTSAVFRSEPEIRENGLRIAWLSDLHLAAENDPQPGKFNWFQRHNPLRYWAQNWMRFKGTPLSQHFAEQNLKEILNQIKILKPGHILVTGDLTNYARGGQFQAAYDLFLETQDTIKEKRGKTLDPTLWTILPGNHDITTEGALGGARSNLGMFFGIFGETFEPKPARGDYEKAFPLVKKLPGSRSDSFVRLIGLDSNVEYPVWVVGINASGCIDAGQMSRLTDTLDETGPAITLVTLHHHPIVVPELASELQDYFLALKDSDGNRLIKLCAAQRVSAILHGHYHSYSSWSGLTPTKRQLAVIGSPAGTINVPDTQAEEFMELCEAERETPTGVEEGLALYRHKRGVDGWTKSYAEVFIPAFSDTVVAV
jgi:3',5'-cyclic AMP phosphodiesterase CpdA